MSSISSIYSHGSGGYNSETSVSTTSGVSSSVSSRRHHHRDDSSSSSHHHNRSSSSKHRIFEHTESSRMKAKTSATQKELKEMRNMLTQLQRDADQQLTLEVETQQTFEFLASQIRALRQAFGSFTYIFEEEIDAVRADLYESHQDLDGQLGRFAKVVKVLQTDHNLLRNETEAFRLRYEADVESRLNKPHIQREDNHLPFTNINNNNNNAATNINNQSIMHQSFGSMAVGVEADGSVIVGQRIPTLSTVAHNASQQLQQHQMQTLAERQADLEKESEEIRSTIDKIQHDIKKLKERVDSYRREQHQAASALAKDVATLADDSSAIKSEHAFDIQKLKESIAETQKMVNSQNESTQKRIAETEQYIMNAVAQTKQKVDELTSNFEQQKDLVLSFQKQQTKLLQQYTAAAMGNSSSGINNASNVVSTSIFNSSIASAINELERSTSGISIQQQVRQLQQQYSDMLKKHMESKIEMVSQEFSQRLQELRNRQDDAMSSLSQSIRMEVDAQLQECERDAKKKYEALRKVVIELVGNLNVSKILVASGTVPTTAPPPPPPPPPIPVPVPPITAAAAATSTTTTAAIRPPQPPPPLNINPPAATSIGGLAPSNPYYQPAFTSMLPYTPTTALYQPQSSLPIVQQQQQPPTILPAQTTTYSPYTTATPSITTTPQQQQPTGSSNTNNFDNNGFYSSSLSSSSSSAYRMGSTTTTTNTTSGYNR